MKHSATIILAALALAACAPAGITKSGLSPADFTDGYNGKPTALYTLTNEAGMEVCITNFGGRIVSLLVPDRDGEMRDVVLGFDNVSSYFPENNLTDFGAAIGRYANRIAGGRFSLDSTEFVLTQNNNGHCLHGGTTGWQYQVYETVEATSESLTLAMHSPDADNGFPGAAEALVKYVLTPDNRLEISYSATTSKPTVINMTNHSYFNLSGAPAENTILDEELYIASHAITPVDDTLIPFGEIASLSEYPDFDFNTPKPIGRDIDDPEEQQLISGGGYDHNWVLDTEGDLSRVCASLYCPLTGIRMDIYTDEPGIQVYSGNFLDGSVTGKKGVAYAKRTAICLETQKYPDSPHNPGWPSAVLRPGETYSSHTVYAFSVE